MFNLESFLKDRECLTAMIYGIRARIDTIHNHFPSSRLDRESELAMYAAKLDLIYPSSDED